MRKIEESVGLALQGLAVSLDGENFRDASKKFVDSFEKPTQSLISSFNNEFY